VAEAYLTFNNINGKRDMLRVDCTNARVTVTASRSCSQHGRHGNMKATREPMNDRLRESAVNEFLRTALADAALSVPTCEILIRSARPRRHKPRSLRRREG
jgi:hypothetical protein